jgi:hypothetical protein
MAKYFCVNGNKMAKKSKTKKDFCFVFSHYGKQDWMYQNYKSLIHSEGFKNVFPVSRLSHGLPRSMSFDTVPVLAGYDTGTSDCQKWMCDALLYHWVLNSEVIISQYKMIILIESDVFWGDPIKNWMKGIEISENCAYACDHFGKESNWHWMGGVMREHHYAEKFHGMTLGSIVGFSTPLIWKMSNIFIKDPNILNLGINELRLGTLANMCEASFKKWPINPCCNNQWGEWAVHSYSGRGIFHPVKKIIKELRYR